MKKRKALVFAFLFTAMALVFATGKTFEQVKTVEQKVYVTKTGKKYHLKDCRTIKKSKNLQELTIQAAKDKGLEPCKVCKPPKE